MTEISEPDKMLADEMSPEQAQAYVNQYNEDLNTLSKIIISLHKRVEQFGQLIEQQTDQAYLLCEDCGGAGFKEKGVLGQGIKVTPCATCKRFGIHIVNWEERIHE